MLIKTGSDIKKFRQLNNLSQYTLAKYLGVTRNKIAHQEYRRADKEIPIDLKIRFRMCKKLDDYIPVYKPEKKLTLWGKIIKLFHRK